MKSSGNFPYFNGWAEGYCSITYSIKERDVIAEYIANQKEHHKGQSFEDEYRYLLKEAGIEADERYIF
jgi:hypothetical protein